MRKLRRDAGKDTNSTERKRERERKTHKRRWDVVNIRPLNRKEKKKPKEILID